MKNSITASDLQTLLADDKAPLLLDVRRKDDFDKKPKTYANAEWKNPAEISQWLPSLSPKVDIVIYCVRGGSVSQSVQQQLADGGLKARYVEGGLEALSVLTL